MLDFIGYNSYEKLYESKHHLIVRAIRDLDNLSVIIKALPAVSAKANDIKKLRQEFTIGKLIESEHVVKFLELIECPQFSAIVYKDDKSTVLSQLIPKEGLQVTDFLKIAIQITKAVYDIHQKDVIHKDIKPSNIIVDNVGAVKLIDFGSASLLKEENQSILNPFKLEGSLAYLSPEQSGRMNRTIDYRTDFYSLGITFFQMLTGRLPFDAKEPMQMLHCHLAQSPRSVRELNPLVPEMIADIVNKLLMKNAEDRYQSTYGIVVDLQKCLQAMIANGDVPKFEIGQQDFSNKFRISHKLYGRAHEVGILLQSFNTVCAEKKPEILIVTGHPGIGKTALINEIQKPITLKNGYFLVGKFDQFNKSLAYSAIIYAFKDLVRQLLCEKDESIQQWKVKLLAALGTTGQVLIEIIPEMELILGKQPPLQILDATDTKNRFNAVFQNFMQVFTNNDHPLVLFLDDLQWADEASLELIKLIVCNPDTKHFLLIGAYRDNEVSISHPTIQALEDINKSVVLKRITLLSLDFNIIQDWLSDTLHVSRQDIKELAELVYQKTQGNPFFVKMFLQALFDEKLLSHSSVTHRWQWDLDQVKKHQATDNVIEFMISRMHQLSTVSQKLLAVASCLGQGFTVDLLVLVMQANRENVENEFQIIFNAGLAYTVGEIFYFAHDRIQEAANLLFSSAERKAQHLHIGRLLLLNIPLENQPEAIFNVVEHFNYSTELLTNENERFKLAELNLSACLKAKQSIAYDAALSYIKAAFNYIDAEHIWFAHYSFAFALYKQQAELEYLTGNFSASEKIVQIIIDHAQSNVQKAEVYNLFIELKAQSLKHYEAIELGRKALALFNIDLPDSALRQILEDETSLIQKNIAGIEIASLANSPEMVDEEKRATVKLLMSMLVPTFVLGHPLYRVVVTKAINLSLRYGNLAESAMCYVFYASILCEQSDTAKLGYEFGMLAIELCKKSNNLAQQCKIFHTFSILVNTWFKPLHTSEALSHQAYKAGLASGEIQYGGFSRYFFATYLFFRGEILSIAQNEIDKCLEFSIKIKNQLATDTIKCVQDAVLVVRGLKPPELQPDYAIAMQINKNGYSLGHEKIFKAWVFNMLGRFKEALQFSIESESLKPNISAHFALTVHNFYYSLNILALYHTFTDEELKTYKMQLIANQSMLQKWSELCPENYQHKYLLVAAEIARVENKGLHAGKLYKEAIKSAKKNGFVHDEAKANELAAQFWLQFEYEEEAKSYLLEAYTLYKRWGANAKLALLRKNYPQFLADTIDVTQPTYFTNTITGTVNTLLLDMDNVIKVSQLLSSNIQLDKLLYEMMKTIIENAGAQKGVLLLNDKGSLLIQAAYNSDGHITVLQAQPPELWEGAHTAIDLVVRTQQPLILDCAYTHKNFENDPHIKKHQIRSVLCMPLSRQGELKGILYVENNLTTFAFNPNRVRVLTVLASQMAISIENALYVKEQIAISERMAEVQRLRAEEAESYKRQQEAFIGTICHEIRNPLTGISGSNEFMNDDIKNLIKEIKKLEHSMSMENWGKVQQYLTKLELGIKSIAECVAHQRVITDDVLNLSKFEANKVSLNNVPFQPKDIIKKVETMLSARLIKKNLSLVLDMPEHDLWVSADPNRFAEIIMNLLSNAIHFTKEGHISLSLTVKNETADNYELFIVIEDTGIGMTSEEKNRIFDRFVQANSQVYNEYGGSGLGLIIAKNIIDLMQGTIHVESEKGKGTIFTITMKCGVVAPTEAMTPSDNKIKRKLSDVVLIEEIKQETILVVEDNEINRVVLSRILNEAGYSCVLAIDGLEAVSLYKRSKFDLIFMDIEMPNMNGIAATREIRDYELAGKLGRTPIIGLSGNARENDKSLAIHAGMDDYITKPYTRTVLLQKINKLVDKHKEKSKKSREERASDPKDAHAPSAFFQTKATALQQQPTSISPSRLSPSSIAKNK